MLTTVVSRLKNVNLFASPITTTNEYELRNERISTRIFVLILTISILIIFIYAAQVQIVQTIKVEHPSYDRFQSLSHDYSQTLRCPCDNVAISHKTFIIVKPEFHQLCSSEFITQQWIDNLHLAADIYISDDFSYTGSLFFVTLASFCGLANKIVMNALETFNSTKFITGQALRENLFNEQINTIINTFQSTTELTFYQSFDLIRFSTQTNALLSGLFSNMVLAIDVETFLITVVPRYYDNNTCNCDITPTCIDPLTLLDRRINETNSSSYFVIPGLFKGCYLVEAVRQSALECLYQIGCLSSIAEFLQVPILLSNPVLPLNLSILSRFNISSTVDQLLTKAMTEVWQENISHTQYFQQCEVSSCTYSFMSRFNILYIVTTLIALVGGLTKILRLLVPRMVRFIRYRLMPPPRVTDEIRK